MLVRLRSLVALSLSNSSCAYYVVCRSEYVHEGRGGACGVGEVSTCSDTTVPHREASIEPVNEPNMHFSPKTTTMYSKHCKRLFGILIRKISTLA